MSPGRLALATSDINAMVGIEYEINVPNIVGDDDDIVAVPDMSYDQPTGSIDDIIDFFDVTDMDSYQIRALRRALERDYAYFVEESVNESWRVK